MCERVPTRADKSLSYSPFGIAAAFLLFCLMNREKDAILTALIAALVGLGVSYVLFTFSKQKKE